MVVPTFDRLLSIGNRSQVHLESVGSQLNAVRKTAREVLNEFGGVTGIALADQPRANDLSVGVDGYPSPSTTDPEVVFPRFRDVLILRANERPDFVALDALAVQVDQGLVHVVSASRAEFHQEFRDGVL